MNQLRGKVTPCKVPRAVLKRWARICKPNNLSTASQIGPTFTGIRFKRICLYAFKLKDRRIWEREIHLKYRAPKINE
jgi:hypothetical protein